MAENRTEAFNALYSDGLKLLADGKDAEAMELFYRAAKTAPEGWLALAVELIKDNQHHLAVDRLKEVLALTNNRKIRAAALNNLGMVWAHGGNKADAYKCFQQAAECAPEFPDTFSNLALYHQWSGQWKESLYFANQALLRDPWHEQAQFIRALTLLLSGNFVQGFQEYECRWRSRNNGLCKIATPWPEWDGSNGQRLFIYGEQGHGDSLLMLRYARLIREKGIHQCWVCQKTMSPLVRLIPEIDEILEPGGPLPQFDCHIPAVSLPRIFKTSIETIPPAPFLQRPEAVDYGPGFHVGICWRGSHTQGNDLVRSTRLTDWAPVLEVPGVTFHSLQVDFAEEALVYPAIKTYDKPSDWLETARRICGMDAVATVDTSIVHLAGALGIPVLVAMHCRPYFVYPPLFGAKTPWYPTVTLYRQQKEFEWKPVMQKIAQDLAAASTRTRS